MESQRFWKRCPTHCEDDAVLESAVHHVVERIGDIDEIERAGRNRQVFHGRDDPGDLHVVMLSPTFAVRGQNERKSLIYRPGKAEVFTTFPSAPGLGRSGGLGRP